ncbi:hypothetical protein BDW67DRAFT_188067 [Aspergillus spinulosporus]
MSAGSSYCVQAVGDNATYSGYGGYSNPCIISVPLPSCCIAAAVSTTDSDWTFPTYTTNTTQPTSLPLAPGTWSTCSTYTQYFAPARNSSTINSCYVVATMYDVDVIDFVSWNHSLSYDENAADPNHCQLSQGYEYCLQLIKATATPTTTTTSTTPARRLMLDREHNRHCYYHNDNSIQWCVNTHSNPNGMAEDCTSFYYVQSGDGCYNIAANNGIALDELYTWDPALNGDGSGLWPDYYICVGVGTTTTTTTTTTTGTVETPTPTQAGMGRGTLSQSVTLSEFFYSHIAVWPQERPCLYCYPCLNTPIKKLACPDLPARRRIGLRHATFGAISADPVDFLITQ